MKKVFFLLLITTGLVAYKFNQQEFKSLISETKKFYPSEAIQKIGKKINRQIKGKRYPKHSLKDIKSKLSDYYIPVEDIILEWKGREKELAKKLNSINRQTIECLIAQTCGELPEQVSAYMDKNQTREHSKLARSLRALTHLKEADPSIEKDYESLKEALNLKNAQIQNRAIELLVDHDLSQDQFDEILGITGELLPQPSSTALVLLSQTSKSEAQRDEVITKAIELINDTNNQSKAIEVTKRAKHIQMNGEDLEKMSQNTCQLEGHNQKLAQYYLSIAAEGKGKTLTPKC